MQHSCKEIAHHFPANLIVGWELDENFITDAMSRAAFADVVSFDIFDTAITRLVDSPVDAFAEMERRLIAEFGGVARGFAQARELAERNARAKHRSTYNAEEIDFQAIYAALPPLMPSFEAYIECAAQIELEVERSTLVAVPDILELSRRLVSIGKPVIFVSDMYLPGSFLAEILQGVGYKDWRALYVSSETHATKHTGRQWNIIVQHYPNLGRILHIGDDEWSDGANPARYGIKTLVYERARSERRVGAALTPDILPFSMSQREVTLQARTSRPPPTSDTVRWRNLGHSLGGILLAGFLRWLEQRVEKHKIDRLYFCARDGWPMQRAWQAAGLGQKTGIEDRYLYISRRPLSLAQGYLESKDNWLPKSLLEFLCQSEGRTSIRNALQRAGLHEQPAIEADMRACFSSLDEILIDSEGRKKFGLVLLKHANVVRAQLEKGCGMTIEYLRQEGLFAEDKRLAVVDLGWRGTMQVALQRIMKLQGASVSLCGFYYGLSPAAAGNRYSAGLMESAFMSDFELSGQAPEIQANGGLIEEFHAAPHGTVTSYEQHEGKWQPIFAASPAEVQQYETMIRHFQDGALETVAELFATGRSGTLILDRITPAAVRAALGAVFMSPSDDEIELIGRLRHCGTFDHSHFEQLVPVPCPLNGDAMRAAFWKSDWKNATLRAWLRNANPNQRQLLQELRQQAFAHWPARALRQFD